MRAPWRGHLAPGDQWVTALALRWLAAWHRDGAWNLKLVLVESPPTAAFAGDRRVVKWDLPGHMLLMHALLRPLDKAPTVERLHRINLGLHLLLAFTSSLVAGGLAMRGPPSLRRLAPLIALHAGAFVLWLPAILYWGQNISMQDFTVLPLLLFVVAARWRRAAVTTRAQRRLLDVAVAAAIVCGVVTDFVFLVVPPYLLAARWLAARRGRPHPDDPWLWTLAVPYAIALAALAWIFVAQGELQLLAWRARTWGLAGAEQSGVLVSLVLRAWFVAQFFAGHYARAYGPMGLLSLGLLLMLWRRPQRLDVPAEVRGVTIDLALPCLLTTVLLAQHHAVHSLSAIKYVPFVTIAWTVLTPYAIVATAAPWRTRLAWLYGAVALLAILPFSSNYRRFFPAPVTAWESEARVLRAHTRPTDTVFSTTIEIDVTPPERIALVERQVTHVYDPLDLLEHTATLRPDDVIALYGPPATLSAFGATPTDVVTVGDLDVARFPVSRLRAATASRPDAALRAAVADVLHGGLHPSDAHLVPHHGAIAAPALPLALHTVDAQSIVGGVSEGLYWSDDAHVHWREVQARGRGHESLTLGDAFYETDWMSRWRIAPSRDPNALAWGGFVRGLFAQAEPMGMAGFAWHFPWRGYDVLSFPVVEPPPVLRARAPAVATWQAYLLFAGDVPAGVALGPSQPGPGWVCVLFDRLAAPIVLPGYVSPDWIVAPTP